MATKQDDRTRHPRQTTARPGSRAGYRPSNASQGSRTADTPDVKVVRVKGNKSDKQRQAQQKAQRELSDLEDESVNDQPEDNQEEGDDNLDQKEKRVPKYEKDLDEQSTLQKFRGALTMNRAIFGGGFMTLVSFIIAMLITNGPILGVAEIGKIMEDFNLGPDDNHKVLRNARRLRSIMKGGASQYRIDEKIGRHDGKISRNTVGRSSIGKQARFGREVKAHRDIGWEFEFKEFTAPDGRRINANGEEQIPTKMIAPDGDEFNPSPLEQGTDIDRAERRRLEANLGRKLREFRPRITLGTMHRLIDADTIHFMTNAAKWERRIVQKAGDSIKATASKLFANRVGVETPDDLEGDAKQFDEERRQGATVEEAKLKVGKARLAASYGVGGTSAIFAGVALTCFARDVYANQYDWVAKNYELLMNLSIDRLKLAAEVAEGFRDAAFNNLNLDVLGELVSEIVSREALTYRYVEDAAGAVQSVLPVTYVDTFADALSWRIASGAKSFAGAVPMAKHMIVGADNSAYIQSMIEDVGKFIDQLGVGFNKLCSAINAELFSIKNKVSVSIGDLLDVFLSIGECFVSSGGGTNPAGCAAKTVAIGQAMDRVIVQGVDLVMAPSTGLISSTIAGETNLLQQGMVLSKELFARFGAPVSNAAALRSSLDYQQTLRDEVDELSLPERMFAIAPGSPGLQLAEWKTQIRHQSISKTATSFIANLPSVFTGAILDLFSGNKAVAQDGISPNDVYFGHVTRDLSHLSEEDIPDEVNGAQKFIEDMIRREDCIYEMFYDLFTWPAGPPSCKDHLAPLAQVDAQLLRDFAENCMGLAVNTQNEGPSPNPAGMWLQFRETEELTNEYQKLCVEDASTYRDAYNQLGIYAFDVFSDEADDAYFNGPVEPGAEVGVNPGLECPANMTPHQNPAFAAEYFEMPQVDGLFYYNPGLHPFASQNKYGSEALLCTIFTAARNFSRDPNFGGGMRLRIGHLNANGHKTHKTGIDVDLSANGINSSGQPTWAANKKQTGYSVAATVALGKALVDTGEVTLIHWCPDGDPAATQILEYARSVGNSMRITCPGGHEDHFHVRIDPSNSKSPWVP